MLACEEEQLTEILENLTSNLNNHSWEVEKEENKDIDYSICQFNLDSHLRYSI